MYDHEQCCAINFYYVSIGFGEDAPRTQCFSTFLQYFTIDSTVLHPELLIRLLFVSAVL